MRWARDKGLSFGGAIEMSPGTVETSFFAWPVEEPGMTDANANPISLPEPSFPEVPVGSALAERRSRRSYSSERISMAAIAALCWAAQGVTDEADGFRTAPSAGATYPMELTVAVDDGVEGLEPGVYAYRPESHALELRAAGSISAALRSACLDQAWATGSGVAIAISAVPERTAAQYGERGTDRYVPMEAGHVGQNVYLAAEALDLGTVCVGAFDDEAVADVLALPEEQEPLAIYPIGIPA